MESVEEASGRMLASADGFSLQAARHLHESDRAGLAFLVRYVLRPPLALSRMSGLPSGNILIRFKRALGNGTGAMELTPMSLTRRLASLVAPPGSHDTCYAEAGIMRSIWVVLHGLTVAAPRMPKSAVRDRSA